MKNATIFIMFLIITSSCAERLHYQAGKSSVETINGFEVIWNSNINERQKKIMTSIVESMKFVEGDVFIMGENAERICDSPAHYVRLSDFYISRIELSTKIIEQMWDKESKYGPRCSRDDWKSFISFLNVSTGLRFDLPTEAQWEYAAKGGRFSKHYVYSGSNNIEDVRISSIEESENCVANELGLMNMSGGLHEWCKDSYRDYNDLYSVDPCIRGGEYLVVRGGGIKSYGEYSNFNKESNFSWCMKDSRMCKVTSRARCEIDYTSNDIGCRLVINL